MPEEERKKEKKQETFEIECFLCKTLTRKRWKIDINYIVCPNCWRLYKIKDYFSDFTES